MSWRCEVLIIVSQRRLKLPDYRAYGVDVLVDTTVAIALSLEGLFVVTKVR